MELPSKLAAYEAAEQARNVRRAWWRAWAARQPDGRFAPPPRQQDEKRG